MEHEKKLISYERVFPFISPETRRTVIFSRDGAATQKEDTK